MAPRANRQLIAAAELGDENGILQALEHGANINYQESSELETALIKAAENGHLNAVQVLLENKAVISVRNRLGWTALHQAAFYGHAKIVEAMIEHGGDVDIKNGQQETPVMLAACYGRVRAVKVLLDHGARADCCDWRGKSAMGYARSSYTASKEEKEQCIAMLQAVLSGSMVLKSKNRAKTKKEQGNAAFRKGDYNRAAILYSDAIKEDPSNHLLYSNRSAAFLEIGRYMLAKEDAIKCIGLNNKFTKGYLRNALANMALGEFEMVERDTRDGLKQNPSEEMTEKLLKLQRKATNARRERDTISEDVIVGEVKGFPASNSMHASRNPIFASGQSEDGLVKVWVTNRGHIDAGTFNGQITLGVLVLNNDDDTVIVDNYDKSFLLTLRNESTQAAIKPECTEIDGESVHGKNLKTVRLRQSQWAVFNLSFLIPAGIVLYENEALKKCHDLVVNFKSSGVEDGVMCHFDLTYIREFYSGFRPGLVCSRFGPPPNPLNPAWFKVQGWSGKDDEYTDYDDEKYMDGFALKVKDTSSSDNSWENTVEITKPPLRDELVNVIEKSFHRTKPQETRPCVVELKKAGGPIVQSDADLSNVKDFMKFEVKFGTGCCLCRKPEDQDRKFSRCSRCKKARYCSRNCQATDWVRHKLICGKKAKAK